MAMVAVDFPNVARVAGIGADDLAASDLDADGCRALLVGVIGQAVKDVRGRNGHGTEAWVWLTASSRCELYVDLIGLRRELFLSQVRRLSPGGAVLLQLWLPGLEWD